MIEILLTAWVFLTVLGLLTYIGFRTIRGIELAEHLEDQ